MRSWTLAAATVAALFAACSSASPVGAGRLHRNRRRGLRHGRQRRRGRSRRRKRRKLRQQRRQLGKQREQLRQQLGQQQRLLGGRGAISQCQQCAETSCGAPLSACQNDTNCEKLLACLDACLTSGCVSSCKTTYAGGVPTYNTLESCLSLDCRTCTESGAGNPCGGANNACDPTSACMGLWCTRKCAHSSDCRGLGPYGGNYTGQPGACRQVQGGDYCFPGCSGDIDCIAFPGTFCNIVMNMTGNTVQVCATAPDAGLGD